MVFDYIIITHLPSFYKINLFNELSKRKSIFVVFIGQNSTSRNSDFIENEFSFDFFYLNDSNFESRNIFFSIIRLINLMFNLKFKKVIVNGWDLPEFWAPILFFNKIKGVIIESTIYESSLVGFKYYFKYIFLRFFNFALPSGMPHKELLLRLRFKGDIFLTGGVGLINFNSNKKNYVKKYSNRALYIGRLSKEKNVEFLINVIKNMPEISLTILGDGPELNFLKLIKAGNIKFEGYVSNLDLHKYFENNDYLILPSKSETWGLVVEEALYHGLPVVVSDSVGSSIDLVDFYSSGYIYKSNSAQSLKLALIEVSKFDSFNRLLENVSEINWEDRKNNQLNAYL
jgi:glycosyltransferase involved in cell wall biosynthesis